MLFLTKALMPILPEALKLSVTNDLTLSLTNTLILSLINALTLVDTTALMLTQSKALTMSLIALDFPHCWPDPVPHQGPDLFLTKAVMTSLPEALTLSMITADSFPNTLMLSLIASCISQ